MKTLQDFIEKILQINNIVDYQVRQNKYSITVIINNKSISISLLDKEGIYYGNEISKTWTIQHDKDTMSIDNPLENKSDVTLIIIPTNSISKLKLNRGKFMVVSTKDFNITFTNIISILTKSITEVSRGPNYDDINKELINALKSERDGSYLNEKLDYVDRGTALLIIGIMVPIMILCILVIVKSPLLTIFAPLVVCLCIVIFIVHYLYYSSIRGIEVSIIMWIIFSIVYSIVNWESVNLYINKILSSIL